MNNIPQELLCKILEYAREDSYMKQESLAQCALTCRSWRMPSQRLFFEAIYIKHKKNLLKAKRVFKVQKDNAYSFGVYVKRLHFRSSRATGTEGTLAMFYKIDEFFPNLEIFLFDAKYPTSYCILYEVIAHGIFKALKQVPYRPYVRCYHYEQCKEYDKCVQMIKERNDDTSLN